MDILQVIVFFFQPVIILLSTFIAVQLKQSDCQKSILSHVYGLCNIKSDYTSDPSILVPLIASIVTVLVLFGLMFISWVQSRFGKKSTYRGWYLSRPVREEHINVFRITKGLFLGGWRLKGNSYWLSDGGERASWHSSQLDLSPITESGDGRIRYVYLGTEHGVFRGEPFTGFANIGMHGKLTAGAGYWIDTKQLAPAQVGDPNLPIFLSRYCKITLAFETFLYENFPGDKTQLCSKERFDSRQDFRARLFRPSLLSERAWIDAFRALPPDKKNDALTKFFGAI